MSIFDGYYSFYLAESRGTWRNAFGCWISFALFGDTTSRDSLFARTHTHPFGCYLLLFFSDDSESSWLFKVSKLLLSPTFVHWTAVESAKRSRLMILMLWQDATESNHFLFGLGRINKLTPRVFHFDIFHGRSGTIDKGRGWWWWWCWLDITRRRRRRRVWSLLCTRGRMKRRVVVEWHGGKAV